MKKFLKYFIVPVIALVIIFAILMAIFNRTPNRDIPTDMTAIISPAHGTVIGVEPITDDVLAFIKKGTVNEISVPDTLIGGTAIIIEMRPKHIHAQRAPVGGVVTYVEHIPGRHANAVFNDNLIELAAENEKTITIIKSDSGKTFGVVQVAGMVARRIVNDMEPGDTVARGDIIGRIKFGSQVLLLLPPDVEPTTSIDEVIIDGESVLGNS